MVSIYDIIISPHPTVQFRNISFEKYSAQMFLKSPTLKTLGLEIFLIDRGSLFHIRCVL